MLIFGSPKPFSLFTALKNELFLNLEGEIQKKSLNTFLELLFSQIFDCFNYRKEDLYQCRNKAVPVKKI